MLEQLAQKFAALKTTSIIASRVTGDTITFVLESGPKLTMTESQLKEAIEDAQPAEPFYQTDEHEETPAERKARLKAEREAKKVSAK